MLIDTRTLPKDEQTYLELRGLYEAAGYSPYKMRRFEEYSLYLDNRNFLGGGSVLTFQGLGGKLLALKPDVTLGIAKNVRLDGDKPVKVYYRESVYRADRGGAEFKEINQMGLEYMGKGDGGEDPAICELALRSLAAIDEKFVFAVSHMGLVSALIESAGVATSAGKKAVMDCIRAKNAHDIAEAGGISAEEAERLASALVRGDTQFPSALARVGKVADNDAAKQAVKELEALYDRLSATKYGGNVRLDFSILNAVDYYNGIIFQGFVERVPKAILSGGRYDGLLAKRGEGYEAMGFALYLDELNACYPTVQEVAK